MRITKAFFSCMALVAIGLLATPGAMATGRHSCDYFDTTVEVAAGPCAVSDPTSPACSDEGEWTGIQYEVTGPADHAATLVTRNNDVSVATGNQFYAPCVGDPVTSLGKYSCHEQAVKINPDALVHRFWVVVKGHKRAIETAMVVKKGKCKKSFAIAGLGLEGPNPFQTAQKTETLQFKGCAVDFRYNTLTGDVLSASVNEELGKPACAPGQNDDTCCALEISDVDKLEIILNDESLGVGQFGEGYISTGESSCTTRVIGGRVYTWGSPCPN